MAASRKPDLDSSFELQSSGGHVAVGLRGAAIEVPLEKLDVTLARERRTVDDVTHLLRFKPAGTLRARHARQ